MKSLLVLFLLFAATLHAGASRLPLLASSDDADWSVQDLDQEMSPGVTLEALFERSSDGVRVVAVRAKILDDAKDRLKSFALGMKDSFADKGVHGLREADRSIDGIKGLGMTFVIKGDDAEIPAELFVFESEDHFYAYMAFGAPAGAETLNVLKKRE